MSDGLIPPLNAPPAGQAAVGVQPGTTGIDLAQVVIVFGTGPGVFVYTPGTIPGPGNPPQIAVTSSSTDPFGNPVPGGSVARIIVQAASGTGPYAELTSSDPNGNVGLLFPSRRPAENVASEINLQINNPGAANEFLITNITGPSITSQPDFVDIGLASSREDGSGFAAAFYEYCDINGIFYECLTIGNTGAAILAVASMAAQHPGATVPTAETWQPASLSNSWTARGAGFAHPQFRLTPDASEIEVLGQISHAAITGSSVLFTISAPYPMPSAEIPGWAFANGTTFVPLNFETSGAVEAFNLPAGTTQLAFHCTYPIGVT
jgi:hypothetical protein